MERQPTMIYHERQQALMCLKHSLNNVVQGPMFIREYIDKVANTLDEVENEWMPEPYTNEKGEAIGPIPKSTPHGDYAAEVFEQIGKDIWGKCERYFNKSATADAARRHKRFHSMIFNNGINEKGGHWYAVKRMGESDHDQKWILFDSIYYWPIKIENIDNFIDEKKPECKGGQNIWFVEEEEDKEGPSRIESFDYYTLTNDTLEQHKAAFWNMDTLYSYNDVKEYENLNGYKSACHQPSLSSKKAPVQVQRSENAQVNGQIQRPEKSQANGQLQKQVQRSVQPSVQSSLPRQEALETTMNKEPEPKKSQVEEQVQAQLAEQEQPPVPTQTSLGTGTPPNQDTMRGISDATDRKTIKATPSPRTPGTNKRNSPMNVFQTQPKIYSPVTVPQPDPKIYSPVTVPQPDPKINSPVTVPQPKPKINSPTKNPQPPQIPTFGPAAGEKDDSRTDMYRNQAATHKEVHLAQRAADAQNKSVPKNAYVAPKSPVPQVQPPQYVAQPSNALHQPTAQVQSYSPYYQNQRYPSYMHHQPYPTNDVPVCGKNDIQAPYVDYSCPLRMENKLESASLMNYDGSVPINMQNHIGEEFVNNSNNEVTKINCQIEGTITLSNKLTMTNQSWDIFGDVDIIVMSNKICQ